jgi:biopolymer transport protein ExbD
MAFKNSRSRVIVSAIDMTPMIDIVFLLIIFFMVAAQFAREANVELNLPAEQGEQDAEHEPIKLVLNILSNGNILLDNTSAPVGLVELELLIKNVISEDGATWQNITIRADEDSSTKVLNNVLVVLNNQGLNATRIATEQP